MEADALQHSGDQLRFAGLQANVEEHPGGAGVLEGAAVAVEPGGEDHAAGAGGHVPHGLRHIVVEAAVHRLLALGHVPLLQVDADLVQGQVVLHPLQALAGGLHLGEVVVPPRLGPHDGGDHGGNVHLLPLRHCGYPPRGAAVDVGAARGGGPRSHGDEGRVPAAAEHRGAGGQSQLPGGLFRQAADLFRGVHQPGQMLRPDAEHPAELLAPALPPGPCIVEEGGVGAVPGHHRLAGAPEDQVLLHVQPLPGPGEVLRLVGLHPLVLPQGVLHAAGHRPGEAQAGQQLPHVGSGDLDAVGDAPAQLLPGPLVHVAHGAADGPALPVHQHQPLHLGAEGDAGHLLRRYGAGGEDLPGGGGHGLPPLVRVLLRPAVRQDVQVVAPLGAGYQLNGLPDGEEAGLDAGGAHVVGQHIGRGMVVHGKVPPNVLPGEESGPARW